MTLTPTASGTSGISPIIIVSAVGRTFLAAVGGYAFTAGFIAFWGVTLSMIGVARGDAIASGILFAFPVYLAVIVWVFASAKVWRTGAIIIALSAGMIGFATFLSKTLPS